MEEATGAPSAFTVYDPRRLRASGRDGGGVVNRPPSPLTMLLSRHTRRREFIAGLSSAVAWPVVGRAQQPDRMHRIAIVSPAVAVEEITIKNTHNPIYPALFDE